MIHHFTNKSTVNGCWTHNFFRKNVLIWYPYSNFSNISKSKRGSLLWLKIFMVMALAGMDSHFDIDLGFQVSNGCLQWFLTYKHQQINLDTYKQLNSRRRWCKRCREPQYHISSTFFFLQKMWSWKCTSKLSHRFFYGYILL